VPDRLDGLREAARARHVESLRRVQAAMESLRRRGDPITFRGLAQAAGVSRSWLYSQPDLRAQVERLRQNKRVSRPRNPNVQRATIESLRQQLQAYREEIARLRAENQDLTDRLARRLGDERAAAVTRRSSVDMSST
jgi:small-conductance mechanosensitive channel